MPQSHFQPGAKFGPYVLVREIAHGGMGYVFEARDTNLDRRVALKIISDQLRKNEDFVKRFLREARTLGRISHPNVVTVHSMGEVEGVHYIAMDFVDGLNLRQFIATGEFFLGDLCGLLRAVTVGLGAIHSNGIVHRDIKLSNILVTKEREAKIGDFGLAKVAGDSAGDITETGQLVGTVQYMAPELLSNEPFSQASDIYSLGLLYFEALVGHNPFLAENTVGTIERIRNLQLAFPEELNSLLPAELRALVLGMTSKKPFARPDSTREILQAFDAVMAAMPAASDHWPVGFAVENMQAVIDHLLARGRSSPLEVSLVLAKVLQKKGKTGSIEVDQATLDEGIGDLGGRAFSLPESYSADDVPSIEIPVEAREPSKKRSRKAMPVEENVELDTRVLEMEQRKEAIAEAKHLAPKLALASVKIEAPPPPQAPQNDSVGSALETKPVQRSKSRFAALRHVLVAGSVLAGVYYWFFAGLQDAMVAGGPECKFSANGLIGQVPYKDLTFPSAFMAFRELGLVCQEGLRCWSRSRPWVEIQATPDRSFPKSDWGNVYAAGSLLVFHDPEKKLLRFRNTEAGRRERLILGLEECVFSYKTDRVPIFRYRFASLAGSRAAAVLNMGPPPPIASDPVPSTAFSSERKAAASQPNPDKGKDTWSRKGWDRFLKFINEGN